MSISGSVGPLNDLIVLETGAVLAGAFCGQLLADFGARVIKIEPPEGRARDPIRTWGHMHKDGESYLADILNRNKELITLDLSHPQGRDVFLDLAAAADVVVENFLPGTFESWGLSYDTLKSRNRGVILMRISGFGQSGPYAERPGFGAIAEAMGGLRALVGYDDRPPVRAGVSIGDELAGMFGFLGILMALRARDRSKGGHGQVVDVAIYEAVLSVIEDLIPVFELAGKVKGPVGTGIPKVAPSNIYPTSDGGWVVIGAPTDSTFRRLCHVMQRHDLLRDARFMTQSLRGEHEDEINQIVRDWCATQIAGDLQCKLAAAGVPATKVYTAEDLLADPHVAARDMIIRPASDRFGQLGMQGVVPKLSMTPGAVRYAGKRRGADTDNVLADLLDLEEIHISQLRDVGAV